MSRILLPSEKRDLNVYCKSMINSIISPIPVFCIKYSMTLWKQRFYCSVYVKEMGPWVTHAAPLLIVRFLWSPCSQPGLGLQLCYVHCVSISIVWWLDVRSLVVFPSLKVSCYTFRAACSWLRYYRNAFVCHMDQPEMGQQNWRPHPEGRIL